MNISFIGDYAMQCVNKTAGYVKQVIYVVYCRPVQAPACKNGPDPFPGQISYKATKPGLAYLSMFFIVLLFIRAPFYVLLVFIVYVLSFGCSS